MQNSAINRRVMKLRTLAHYCPTLTCPCGEDDFDKLTLDHIYEGRGNEDRTRNGCSRNGSWNATRFYNNIRKAGYPPIYQVLCAKCNFAKNRQYQLRMNAERRKRREREQENVRQS